MNNKRLLELAGVVTESTEQEKILESMMGGRGDMIATKIIEMAKGSAYDVGAEQGNVTLDMVYDEAKKILSEIENAIADTLQVEFDQTEQNQSAETEQQMGADRNMANGETNFNAADKF